MDMDEFAELTRRVIARDGFEGYLPTACYAARAHFAVLTGVPPHDDVEPVSLEWALEGAESDEEVLVAFKIDPDHFKIIRRTEDARLEQRVYLSVWPT
jgi:GGDEF domain-containing protein